jgi:hypothetical protein
MTELLAASAKLFNADLYPEMEHKMRDALMRAGALEGTLRPITTEERVEQGWPADPSEPEVDEYGMEFTRNAWLAERA